MLSREYTLKLNQWVIDFTGNANGKTPYGNLSEILSEAFPTDAEMKPFLTRAYSTSPRWLFLWKQGSQLIDFNGKVYDAKVLSTSAHVYTLPNKIGLTIYAVDPNMKSAPVPTSQIQNAQLQQEAEANGYNTIEDYLAYLRATGKTTQAGLTPDQVLNEAGFGSGISNFFMNDSIISGVPNFILILGAFLILKK